MALPVKSGSRDIVPVSDPEPLDPADPSGMGGWVAFVDIVEILVAHLRALLVGALLAFLLLRYWDSLGEGLQVFLGGGFVICAVLVGWPVLVYKVRREAHMRERRKIYESQVHGSARAANAAEVHAALKGGSASKPMQQEFDD